MRGARIALLAALTVPAVASAQSLTVDHAQRVANHVKHRERLNAFHMRRRIGGPFALSHTSCDPRKPGRVVVCSYVATAYHSDANEMRMRCSVDVTVRQAHWKRKVTVCALQMWPAP